MRFIQRFRLKIAYLFVFLIFSGACATSNSKHNLRFKDFPPIILWAWERPEHLNFLDTNKYGVAFLAQTVRLENEQVLNSPRRQELKVNEGTFLVAVTRIETDHAALSDAQKNDVVALILKTLQLKNVRAVQIDFDAAVSEREFYKSLLADLRQKLPDEVPLSITALASFCLGDRWLFEITADEIVPMIFRMGMDEKAVKNTLSGGGDFKEKRCRESYGISVDEPLEMKLNKTRRFYIFNPRPWMARDLAQIEEIVNR